MPRYRVSFELDIDDQYDKPSKWDWDSLLDLTPEDNFRLIESEQVSNTEDGE